MPLPVPPLEEQQSIAASVQLVDANTRKAQKIVERSIDRLRELRAALITAAVTGQIDPATWRRRGDTDRRLDQIEEPLAS